MSNVKVITCPNCGKRIVPKKAGVHRCTGCNIVFYNKTEQKTLTCFRCGHFWKPRFPRKPRICPNCKSWEWNIPQKEAKAK